MGQGIPGFEKVTVLKTTNTVQWQHKVTLVVFYYVIMLCYVIIF